MRFEIGKLTIRIISQLYTGDDVNRTILASLRGAASLESPKAQAIWPLMLAALNRNQLSRDGTPTPTEIAVYAALRLYAIQQQGRDAPVYELKKKDELGSNINLFAKLAGMRANSDRREALDRRFQMLVSATTIDGVIHSLVSLVNIVRSDDKSVTIDYPRLAEDLYWFQMNFEQSNRVKLSWGQEYYRVVNQGQKVEETTNND